MRQYMQRTRTLDESEFEFLPASAPAHAGGSPNGTAQAPGAVEQPLGADA
jgi:hypothetical protein